MTITRLAERTSVSASGTPRSIVQLRTVNISGVVPSTTELLLSSPYST